MSGKINFGPSETGTSAAERGASGAPFVLAMAANVASVPDLTYKDAFEEHDNLRATARLNFRLTMQSPSWLWPASFFFYEGRNTRVHEYLQTRPDSMNARWILDSYLPIATNVISGSPGTYNMRLGDVLIFTGNSTMSGIQPARGSPISHSAIATARPDEVSQKWWNRDLQLGMVGELQEILSQPRPNFNAFVPSMGLLARYTGFEYPVTRDTLSDLLRRFTVKDRNGTEHYFYENRFDAYRFEDRFLRPGATKLLPDREAIDDLMTALFP